MLVVHYVRPYLLLVLLFHLYLAQVILIFWFICLFWLKLCWFDSFKSIYCLLSNLFLFLQSLYFCCFIFRRFLSLVWFFNIGLISINHRSLQFLIRRIRKEVIILTIGHFSCWPWYLFILWFALVGGFNSILI